MAAHTVAPLLKMAHLDTVTMQPPRPPGAPPHEPAASPPAPPEPFPVPAEPSRVWYVGPVETREIRKARERADRASRRADRAARRVRDAEGRAGIERTGGRQLLDVAGDAATAALTAVSAAADEAHARLAAKARMRELEHAVITARAGGRVDVSPPTREEALKLADRMDPGSSEASFVRGFGFILAGIAAILMALIGGFGWLGVGVPVTIVFAGGWLGSRIELAERSRMAGRIQLEVARASLPALAPGATGQPAQGVRAAPALPGPALAGAPVAMRPSLFEEGDPRTRSEIVARLDRLVANARGLVEETDVATLQRIRDSAALALPATDAPLDLTNHETWLLRQICIDYLPGALEHYIALPSGMASEPVLDGRSARQVLDEQLALIESRLDKMATRMYQREAGGLLTHARFVTDVLGPDPFQARLAELAAMGPDPVPVAAMERAAAPKPFAAPVTITAPEPLVAPVAITAPEPVHISEPSVTMDGAHDQPRERA